MPNMPFVNATDLSMWADRRDCQGALPRLIRRLILATTDDVLRADFPADEGVQAGGWDGIVSAEQGNAFVPDGISVWEVSANKDIKGKADDDYTKRTKNPAEIEPASSTYVFVTSRRWKGKRAWQNDRQSEGIWRAVRAYDADDLESWLQQNPAVHIWLSVLLGRHPDGAEDLDNWWEDWSAATDPRMSPSLVLAGRTEMVEKIQQWLGGHLSTIAIQSESREEALAVFAAALQGLADRDAVLSRTVVVRDVNAWDRLFHAGANLILIPQFVDAQRPIARACRRGSRVIVLLGRSDSTSEDTVVVPRISRREAERVLTDGGIPREDARELALLARRSLTSLRRKIAIRPEVQRPKWAYPEEAGALLPALFAGRWDCLCEGDRRVIEALGGKNYDGFSDTLIRWSNEPDPPFRRVGNTWYLVSPEDAWTLLARYVTEDDLRRLSQAIGDVLSEFDPRFDLEPQDWWKASLLQATPGYSAFLRQGLADTLAIMGTLSDTVSLSASATAGNFAAQQIRKLLAHANEDWRIWASLSSVLPLLAEAAPDEFLNAVEAGLDGPSPALIKIFQDKEGSTSSSHTGLLWALETLAWSSMHLASVALLLARLAHMDPGGRLANRPARSLQEIFLLWHPQTSASSESRADVLEMLSQREPWVAWQLLRHILPQERNVAFTTARPRWRDWAPADSLPHLTYADLQTSVRRAIDLLLKMVGTDGERWSEIFGVLHSIPEEQRMAFLELLEEMKPDALPEEDGTAIWNALRYTLYRHRSYPHATWALPSELLPRLDALYRRFCPSNPFTAHAWLFSDRPPLPEGRDDDWRAYKAALKSARLEAIQKLTAASDLESFLGLVSIVENAYELGAALGSSAWGTDEETDLLLEYLGSDDKAYSEFASGFVTRRIESLGRQWAEAKLANATTWSAEKKAALMLCLPADTRTWNIGQNAGKDVEEEYWRAINPYAINSAIGETAAARLVEHQRPCAAIDILGFIIHRKGTAPTELIMKALEALPNSDPEIDRPVQSVAHRISELLQVMASSGEVDEAELAKLEWQFLPALSVYDQEPRFIYRELAKSPDLFVAVVSLVYKGENEDACTASPEGAERASRAFELLYSWRIVPGSADGHVDEDALKAWVTQARQLLKESGRRVIGDQCIGQVLSGSRVGNDGVWPHEAVRNLIEDVRSEHIEKGLTIGVYNSRGVFTKALDEGGAQEQALAAQYHAYAEAVQTRCPRTAAMLRRIANNYVEDARIEDHEAELREDIEN